MPGTTRWKAYIALIAVCFFWGTTYLAIRLGVESLPPFLFAGVRFLIAGGLMTAWFIIKRTPLPSLAEWKNILLISVLFFVVGNTSVVHAEQHISSGLAALICAAIPIWVVVMNMMMQKSEKINAHIILGLIIGFAGLIMIFYDNIAALTDAGSMLSVLFLLFGNLTWSYGTVYSKNINWKTPLLFVAGLQMLLAGIQLSLVGFISGEAPRFTPEFDGWMSILYLALIGSVVTYGAYMYALSKLPSTVVSLYAYVNPIVAVFLGWMLLNEQFGVYTLIAMAITLFGVRMVNTGFKRKSSNLENLVRLPKFLYRKTPALKQ